MPSVPLYYQPLVLARALAAPVDDAGTTAIAAHTAQDAIGQQEYADPKKQPIMQNLVAGITSLPGAKDLGNFNFSFDDTGYVAHRVVTAVSAHPELFDMASPSEAAQIGAGLVKQARAELTEPTSIRITGNTIDFAPSMTRILKAHWDGEETKPEDAATVGIEFARAAQHAVTPLPPDSTHPKLQWLEDATAWTFATWPGVASQVAGQLGFKVDPKAVDPIVEQRRGMLDFFDPKAAPAVRALGALLGAVGVSTKDPASGDRAYDMLQSTPLDDVPAGIAHAIVQAAKLPEDAVQYFASRIVESGGSEGNIAGLVAEIESLKPKPKPDPAKPAPADPAQPAPADPADPAPADPAPPAPADPAPADPAKPADPVPADPAKPADPALPDDQATGENLA